MVSQWGWAAILLLNIAFILSRTSLCEFGKTKHTYIGNDYPMRLPINLKPVQGQFDCSIRYALTQNSSTTSQVWTHSTDTQSNGILRLGPDRRVFAISMYHQLHCLDGLSKALTAPLGRRIPASDGHVGHCLNYLRQVFQCSADATEEPLVQVSMLKKQGGCAPSFIRQCKDWTTLYDFITANYLAFHEFKVVNGSWSCTGQEYMDKETDGSKRPIQAELCALSAAGSGQHSPHAADNHHNPMVGSVP